MKRLTFVMMFLVLGLCSLVSADRDIGVFANNNTTCIQFIDPQYNTATEPLLVGELRRHGSDLLDVVITHDGKTAIVSSFSSAMIFFIDISAGFDAPPTLLGSVRTWMYAEDMVITPDDKFVLITDGSLSYGVSVVEIATRRFIRRNNLGWREAQAIVITPDGQTVLVADYYGRMVHAYTLDSDNGRLTFKKTIRIGFQPVNLAMAPDGRTVIVPVVDVSGSVILYFDTAGNLFYKGTIAMPSMNGQSCVFSEKKKGKYPFKAYYLSNSQVSGTRVHILNVTGVGQVSPSGTSIKIWPRRGTSQLFGVDTMALNPDESYLYVTNPTLFGAIADVALIDLNTNSQVGYIPATGIPTGIAFARIKPGNGHGKQQ